MPKKRKSRFEKLLEADRDAEQRTTRQLVESYELHPLDDYVNVTERTNRQLEAIIDE